jgi:high-affinity iron transporter
MFAEFLIFLREGLEGSMIVAILLAALRQLGETRHARAVWLGVAAALAVAVGGGVAAYLALHAYDGTRLQTALEGGTYFVAAAVLTYMTFWMRRESAQLRGSLTHRARQALERRGGMALAALAFVTVAREGLETVVFSLAIALAAPAWQAVLGAAVGLVAALALSRGIYGLGLRVNLGRFFAVMGTLLMLSAAGLLADGIEDYQALGWLPGGGALWNTSALLPEGGFAGDLLHTFLGYAARPSPLQVGAYAVYLAAVLALWLGRREVRSAPVAGSARPADKTRALRP